MDKEYLLSVIGTYKIKYDVLNSMNDVDRVIFMKNNKKTKAFHIDLSFILSNLNRYVNYSEITNTTSKELGTTISSAIINMVAHYRAYFAKKKLIDVNIFLYYTDIKIDNTLLSHSLEYARMMLSVIFKYIPKVYFIDNDKIDSYVSMYHFINKYQNNLLMTKNKILYQYLSDTKPTVEILNPYRDMSGFILKSTWVYHWQHNKECDWISPNFIPLILSIKGKDYYPGFDGYGDTKSFKYVCKAIKNSKLQNNLEYISVKDIINDLELTDENQIKCIKKNYPVFNLKLQYSKLRNVNKIKLDDLMVDNFSKKELKVLNLKYFTNLESLMLQELLIGITDTKSDKIVW